MAYPFVRSVALVTVLLAITAPVVAGAEDAAQSVDVPTERGEVLRALVNRPAGKGPFPAVILGSGMGYHMRLPILESVARSLARSGVAVLRFDWAYHTREGDKGKPSPGRQLEIADMAAVVRHARAQPWIDARRLAVGGKSLGSIVAWNVLRADPAIKGALLLTPVCAPKPDEPDVVGTNYPDVANEARPTAWIVGQADPVCSTSVLYGHLAKARDAARVVVVRGDHAFADDLRASRLPDPQTDRTSALVGTTAVDFATALLGASPPGRPATTEAPRAYEFVRRETADLRLFVFPRHAAVTKRPSPAILLFHSGGWTRGRPQWLFEQARKFAAAGFTSIAAEYRLSAGAVRPSDAFDDVCEAFRWVRSHARELNVDGKRVVGYGASAGATMVAAAATAGCGADATDEGSRRSGKPDALVLISPGLDLEGSQTFATLSGPGVDAAARSPLRHVDASLPPTFVVVGERDTVTPARAVHTFCEKAVALARTCSVHPYPELGHLLTRNLANQRTAADPDPGAAADAFDRQLAFLRGLGLVDGSPAVVTR